MNKQPAVRSLRLIVAAIIMIVAAGSVRAREIDSFAGIGAVGYSFGLSGDQYQRYQSFTLNDARTLTAVCVKARKYGNPSDVTVEIRPTVYTWPPVDFGVGSIPASSFSTTWAIGCANVSLSLPAGTYFVVLGQASPSRSSAYEWATWPSRVAESFGKINPTGSSTYPFWPVDESGLGDGWLEIHTAGEGGLVDLSHRGTTGYSFGLPTDQLKRFQAFVTPSWATALSGVDVKVRKTSDSIQTDLTVELYATANGVPTGSALAWASVPASEVSTTWTVVRAPLMYGYLNDQTMYAIVLSQSSLQTASYEWAAGAVDAGLAFGKWNGSSWVDESGLGDGWLKVWTSRTFRAIGIEHAGTTGFGFGNSVDELKRYQILDLGDDREGPLFGADLKLRRFGGTGQSAVIVGIYAVSNNRPTGSALASAVIPAAAVGQAWSVVHAPLSYRGFLPRSVAVVVSQSTLQSPRYEWATANLSNSLGFGKWNGSAWIDESGLGDGWVKLYTPAPGDTTGIADVSHAGTYGYGFGHHVDELRRFQTFKTSDYGNTVALELKLRKIAGTAQSDVVAELYAAPNNVPTGLPVARTVIPAFLVGQSWTIVTVPFSSDYLSSAQTYAVVLGQRVPQEAHYEWCAGNVSSTLSFGKWNGSSWLDESSLGDGWMRVWSEAWYIN